MSKEQGRTDVTLVTHLALPDGAPDDVMLADALRARGLSVRLAPWNSPLTDWSSSPLTVIRSAWDYHLHASEWRVWIEQTASRTALMNSPSVLHWNTDKRYLLELIDAGVPCVRTWVADHSQPVWDDMADTSADWIIKPAVGASAKGVRRFSAAALPHEGRQYAQELSQFGAVLLQPFVPEVAGAGERSLVFLAGAFSHAFTKPAFSANAAGTSSITRHTVSGEELRVAQWALRCIHELPLYARVDLVPTKDGPVVMELELIEPDLGLRLEPGALERLASLLERYVKV